MTAACEFCTDDTDAKFYLESEAPGDGVGAVERIVGNLCRRHARAVREALLLLDDNHTERGDR